MAYALWQAAALQFCISGPPLGSFNSSTVEWLQYTLHGGSLQSWRPVCVHTTHYSIVQYLCVYELIVEAAGSHAYRYTTKDYLSATSRESSRLPQP